MTEKTFTTLDNYIKKPIRANLPAELSVKVAYFAEKFNCTPNAIIRIALYDTISEWEQKERENNAIEI